MAWGGGTYTKPYTWTAGTPILATDHNAQDTDFTNGINNCLAKDGQNAMTGNLSLGGNILTNVGAGSAATPSFSPGADVDTGMFLAGTNALGYATGGVERMRISNAGQVGVGTTSPLDMLDVSSAAATFRARIRNSTANEAYALFQNTATGTTTTDGLLAGIDYLGAGYFWNHENQPNVFGTNNAERMRIAANGNVGIGTSSPVTALDVVGTTTIGFATPGFTLNLGRGTAFGRQGYLAGDGTTIEFNNQQNGDLWFGTNNTEKLRITSGGNVGIGTHAPLDRLDVASGASGFRARFRNTTANEALALFQNSNTGTGTTDGMAVGINSSGVAFCWNHENNDLLFGTNNLERMRITSGGVVQVTDPNATLLVGSSNTSTQACSIEVGTNRTQSGVSYIDLIGDTTYPDFGTRLIRNAGPNGNSDLAHRGTGGLYLIAVDAGFIAAATSGVERMRITSGGNVGIGTTTPSTALDVNGTVTIGSSPDPGFLINLGRGTAFGRHGYISGTGTGIEFNNQQNGPLLFSTNNAERMRITSGGEVYIAGNIDQGAYNLQVNGTGVWGAGAYVNGSDARIKENVAPISSSLSVVKTLNPVTFQYKEDWTQDRTVQTGFIAQELQSATQGQAYQDGLVLTGGQYLSVAYQNLIPILTKAIQELTAKVESLEAQVASLAVP